MSRYGWDRDELYFLSAAHHLALGYVDFPPLIAVVGWMIDKIAPHSLVALRMVSLAAGAATVLLVAFIVRELGGGRRAQMDRGTGLGADPLHPGVGKHLSPDLARRARVVRVPVRGGSAVRAPRAAALAAARPDRRHRARGQVHDRLPDPGLRRRAAADPGATAAGERRGPGWGWRSPRRCWRRTWSGRYSTAGRASTSSPARTRRPRRAPRAPPISPSSCCSSGRPACSPSPAWSGCGDAACARSRSSRSSSRWSSCWSAAAATTRSRPTRWPWPPERSPSTGGCEGRRRLALLAAAVALQAAVIALAGPIVVPFYSTRQLVSSSVWKIGYFKDEIGWPEMTAQVERAWAARPANERAGGAILAHNYGEASALAFYGHGLPTDSQRTPQLAVLAPGAAPGALRPHRRLRHGPPLSAFAARGGHWPTSTTGGISTTKNAAS